MSHIKTPFAAHSPPQRRRCRSRPPPGPCMPRRAARTATARRPSSALRKHKTRLDCAPMRCFILELLLANRDAAVGDIRARTGHHCDAVLVATKANNPSDTTTLTSKCIQGPSDLDRAHGNAQRAARAFVRHKRNVRLCVKSNGLIGRIVTCQVAFAAVDAHLLVHDSHYLLVACHTHTHTRLMNE